MNKSKEENNKYLFSGLSSILIGWSFEAILDEFRGGTYKRTEAINTPDVLDNYLTKANYKYDPVKDVRIVHVDDGDGKPYEYHQTFDDYFIELIQREIDQINSAIDDISFHAVSYDNLEIKMKYYLKELEDLHFDPKEVNWKPLTEKTFRHITEALANLKTYIVNKLELREYPGVQIAENQTTTQIAKSPGFVKSSWAVRNQPELNNLYKDLKSEFIRDEVDRSNVFKKILSGKELPLKSDRIKWENQRALKYFITKLGELKITCPPDKGKIAFDLPKDKWLFVKNCFIKPYGGEFDHISTESKSLAEDLKKKIDHILGKLNL